MFDSDRDGLSPGRCAWMRSGALPLTRSATAGRFRDLLPWRQEVPTAGEVGRYTGPRREAFASRRGCWVKGVPFGAAAGGRGGRVRRVRKAIYSLMAVAVTLLIVGCGSGHSAAPAPQPKTAGSPPASLGPLVGRPQEAVLRLPRGRSAASFAITAVPHDTWDVRVTGPASADFEVNVLKSDGERLSLLETTHQRVGCAITGTRVHCFLRFAIGANQTPGRWTVIAAKHAGSAAAVRVQITFHRPGSE